jgi:GH15 family glucan-1,4-alpha-glucosidase
MRHPVGATMQDIPRPRQAASSRIEDYALIGDCETAALVSKQGSIDWLCWPRFDSAACFAALLGGPEHGRWLIAPIAGDVRVSRHYHDGTLVLETVFETPDGAVSLIDFMPLRSDRPVRPHVGNSDLLRIVVGRRGEVPMRVDLVIRFDYGASVPWVYRLDDGALCAVAGPNMLVLRTRAPLRGEGLTTVGEFIVREGETVAFDLMHVPSHLPPPPPIDAISALESTTSTWRRWSGCCMPAGAWSDAVQRSLITLKALTYGPTGGIVAAPTTSLPEQLGGTRNWDYRYCWLRDSAFTLTALMGAGYYDEARAWRDWLLRAVAGSPAQMQILYGIAGERHLPEHELPWLPGYEQSRPVRVGNAAAGQFQLDLYGEVMDVMVQAVQGGIDPHPQGWQVGRELLDHLERVWSAPDEGIWEVRGPPQHFTHSKVIAWVAVDRAIRAVEALGMEGPLERWHRLRQAIHDNVCVNGFNPELGSFVQAYGSTQLDASLLQVPLVGFLPPDDPRVRGTVAAIEQRLMRDGLVRRYDTTEVDDGLPPGEGAFLACSFWLADNYVLQGRYAQARELFESLLALRNDVGLLAEMYDRHAQRQIGNFPQAFSHIALINTALRLTRTAKGGPSPA